MSERDLPFARAGYCQVCRQVAHGRTLNYEDIGEFLNQEVSTLKTWNSVQNTWLKNANSKSRDIAWRMLQWAVNNRPAGAPTMLFVAYNGKPRAFRPVPPPISRARWHGCVIAAYFYSGVLLSARFDAMEYLAAVNLRKQIEGKVPPPSGATFRRS